MIPNRFQVITGFEGYRGRKEIPDQIDRLINHVIYSDPHLFLELFGYMYVTTLTE